MKKSIEAVRALLEEMASNAYHWSRESHPKEKWW